MLVPALGDASSAEAAHRFHIAEEMVEYVAPVAEHVHDDAAAILLAVVPARPLRRLPIAFEDPITELAAHRKDAAEETRVDEPLELAQARQIELVLHYAVFYAGGFGKLRQAKSTEARSAVDRLFAVDVFASGDGGFHGCCAQIGELRVEVKRVGRIGERFLQIG